GHLARLRVILERRRETVGRAGRTLGHLALVVELLDLVLGRDRLDLRLGKAGAARLGEVAERHQLEAVTVLADVVIDLEAALQLAAVVGAERPGERPPLRRRPRALLGG